MSLRRRSCTLLLLGGCILRNPAYDEPGVDLDTGAPGTTGAPDLTTGPGTSSSEPTTAAAPSCQVDADCDDGLHCSGQERCDPGAPGAAGDGCVAGPPPCPPGTCDEQGATCLDACEVDADADDDGVPAIACGGGDCDDADAAVFPGQQEQCDAVDDDCDPATLGPDADQDGLVSYQCCNDGPGGQTCGLDCDDAHPGVVVGDWAHCTACGAACGEREACVAGACVGSRRVFTTSSSYAGDFGGLAVADAACQKHADAAALGGAFKAYLVDESTGLERLEHAGVPYVHLDGEKIADDWNDLTDGDIAARLDRDEFRQPVGGNAWTGLQQVNGLGVVSCDDWTSAEFGCLDTLVCGGAGETNMTDEHWDGWYIFNCSDEFRLYCLEQ